MCKGIKKTLFPKPPNAPTLPNVPGFSQEEQDILKSRKDVLQRFSDMFLGNFSDQAPDPLQAAINKSEQERYQRALEGKLPVSVGLQQQKEKEFALLKESAASRGINISGGDPASAVSNSTAGIRILSEFNKRYDLAMDTERQGAIAQGGSQNIARLGLLNQGQALKASIFGQYQSGLSDLSGVYQNQRLGQFSRDTNQATAAYQANLQKYQGRLGQIQGFGQLGGQLGAAALLAA